MSSCSPAPAPGTNGATVRLSSPVPSKLPNSVTAAIAFGSIERGKRATFVGMAVSTRDAGVERTHVRAQRVNAEDGLDVVVAVARDERPHNAKLVRELGELRE